MKLSIGWRLFVAVLFALLSVISIALFLMQRKISTNFADYAAKIELDRLQELSESIQTQYQQYGEWHFLPEKQQEKVVWIHRQLLQLYQQKIHSESADSSISNEVLNLDNPNTLKSTQVSPPSKQNLATQQSPAPAQARSNSRHHPIQPVSAAAAPMPPAPPVPPVPPLPPLPLIAPPQNPEPVGPPDPIFSKDDNSEFTGLVSRISLLDSQQQYLAGQVLEEKRGSQRALLVNGQLIGYLFVQQSARPTDALAKDFLQQQSETIFLIVLISVGLSGVLALFLALHIRRPIFNLAEGARKLADGDFNWQLDTSRRDELGTLAESFNNLARKLQATEQQRRQWVANTSHELRTPVSVLRAQIEAIQDQIRPINSENIALMHRQVLSLNKLIDELYLLAQSDVGALTYQIERINLAELIHEEIENFQEKVRRAQLSLTLQTSHEKIETFGDVERLRQVCRNLFENSLRYTDVGGQIKVNIRVQNERIMVDIEDSAPGVSPQALEHLGERFFRGEHSRNRQSGGSGLGLALCKQLLAAQRIGIQFSHSNLGGLQVQLCFALAH
ncbi:ATP-binding protein [Undibacterium fentianense]|uniref:histidine kinase n=1 Tax=Undibacterium fentianense TaxID=2828728 RepID=A0A941E294_9BURK|nr:ATP-binding protein [Undibacterium fentianense]MBR7801020.1 HAMP domain-containing protein [Undibacterium fentianense]